SNEPATQESRVAALAAELARQQHEVTVYARRDAADLPEQAKLAHGATVRYVPAGPAEPLADEDVLPHIRSFSDTLAELWRGDKPDVVHAIGWTGGLAALAATRDHSIPVVQTFHSLRAAERRHHIASDGISLAEHATAETGSRDRLERAVARSADLVIATNEDEVSDLASLGVPRSGISVLPFGVDSAHFAPEGPIAPRDERPRLVAVATHLMRDGLETVVRALPEIPGTELIIVGGPAPRPTRPGPELLVAGGPARQMLRRDKECCALARLAGRRGVADRVKFAGQVS